MLDRDDNATASNLFKNKVGKLRFARAQELFSWTAWVCYPLGDDVFRRPTCGVAPPCH